MGRARRFLCSFLRGIPVVLEPHSESGLVAGSQFLYMLFVGYTTPVHRSPLPLRGGHHCALNGGHAPLMTSASPQPKALRDPAPIGLPPGSTPEIGEAGRRCNVVP